MRGKLPVVAQMASSALVSGGRRLPRGAFRCGRNAGYAKRRFAMPAAQVEAPLGSVPGRHPCFGRAASFASEATGEDASSKTEQGAKAEGSSDKTEEAEGGGLFMPIVGGAAGVLILGGGLTWYSQSAAERTMRDEVTKELQEKCPDIPADKIAEAIAAARMREFETNKLQFEVSIDGGATRHYIIGQARRKWSWEALNVTYLEVLRGDEAGLGGAPGAPPPQVRNWSVDDQLRWRSVYCRGHKYVAGK
eukprot:TRINITY_DN93430_c0_g1_i1.p1 TRINITY_DN93430_c0_g1~~TRINITY_DN93430_c0_g1_i1.p1  ORF type:complete len:249 (-),score=41.67 TRINITY_DN93430_c0_g1_i1:90-836(-)